jgi:hypothetical protein
MKRFASEFEKAEKALDSVIDETRAADLCIAANREANQVLAHAGTALTDGNERIAEALSSIAEDAVRLRASEARLLFENARLKRSGKNLRGSLDLLREAHDRLGARTREAYAIAETAGRTQSLIDRINDCVTRGEPVDHLLAVGAALVQESHGRKRHSGR